MALFDSELGQLLDSLTMNIAAGSVNGKRHKVFISKIGDAGYNGPRILAEGDSWFCYPTESPLVGRGPKDVVVQLGQEFAIATQAVPGELMRTIRVTLEGNGSLMAALGQFEIDVLLLSGGGNDLLGAGRLEALLLPGPKEDVAEYFETAAFQQAFWSVIDDQEEVLRRCLRRHDRLKAVIHGYDYAVPSGAGPWLKQPLTALGVPEDQQRAVIRQIVDWFNRAQRQVVDKLNGEFGERRVFHADLRGAVAADQWFDEIHPTTAGFKAVVKRLREAILKAHPLVA